MPGIGPCRFGVFQPFVHGRDAIPGRPDRGLATPGARASNGRPNKRIPSLCSVGGHMAVLADLLLESEDSTVDSVPYLTYGYVIAGRGLCRYS